MRPIFKTISSDESVSGFKIGNVFSEIAKKYSLVKNVGGGYSFNSDFVESLESDTVSLNKFNAAIASGVKKEKAFQLHMETASTAAQDFARNMNTTNLTVADFVKQHKMQQVSIDAQSTKLQNVRLLLDEYNSGLDTTGNICKNTGLAQQDFAEAVGESNRIAGNYLKGLNGGQATMRGYVSSLISAKAATIGLQAATIALNAAISMGVMLAIQFVIKAFDELITTNEEVAESAKKAMDEYKQAQETLKSNKATIEEISSDYEKLSKGVDKLGNNVSLSASEYERYHEVVNKVADMFPDMVSGYDSEGNAILNTKGKVEELTEAYQKQAQAARDALVYSGQDVFKNFQNNTVGGSLDGLTLFTMTDAKASKQIRALEKALDKSNSLESLYNDTDMAYLISAFEGAGIEWSWFDNTTSLVKRARENESVLRRYIKSQKETINSETSAVREVIDAYVRSSDEFQSYDDETKETVNNILQRLDFDYYKQFEGNYGKAKSAVMENFVIPINDNSYINNAIELISDVEKKFNDGTASVGRYAGAVSLFLSNLKQAGLDEDTIKYYKLAFEIDVDENGQVKQIENVVSQLINAGIDEAQAREFVGMLKLPEFKELINNGDKFRESIAEWVNENEGYTYEQFSEWFTGILEKSAGISAAASSKIIAAFDSASQAATDFADSLKDIKSGTESFESYADAYKDAMELISKGADLDNGKLLAYAEYILGKDRIAELGYNVKKVKKALETVRVMYGDAEDLGAGMVARLSQVVDKSGKLLDENGETIATYNKKTGKWWVSNSHLEDVAKVLGTTKDGLAASIQALATHSNVVLENINEIKLRAEAVGATMSEKFNGKDVINSVTLEAKLREDGYTDKQVYDVLALLKKDKKHTILINLTTSSSSKDIIDVLSKLELVGKDSEGTSFVNLNEMVNAFKESGATIPQIIDYITKLNDEGEIQIKVDGITETDLGKLKSSVENYYNHGVSSFEQANAKLKNLGLIDFDMNFDMSEEGHVGKIEVWIENLQESLNKLRNEDGTINFQAEGATELVAIMTELISQKQVLTEPAIMKIKTDGIDDAGLKSAIEQIQNYQRLMNDFELETTLGVDTTETQNKLRSAASEMKETIPDEILTTLNIDKDEWDKTLDSISNSTIDVKANVGVSQDDLTLIGEIFKGVSDIDEFTIGEKKIKVTIANNIIADLDVINNYTFKKKTIKIGYEQTPFGGFRAVTQNGGNVEADGTAHAHGSWATKKDETALVGELGREIIVNPRAGKWQTVGDNGAEFRHIPKGSIVFNHKQTEELLRNGHINGRGTAFVNGTAYSEGIMSTNDIAAMIKKAQEAQKKAAKAAAKTSKKKTTKKSTKKSSTKKSGSKKSSSSSSSKDNDFVDWIEVKISRVERAIKNLETKVKSTFQTLTTRLKATDNEIPKLNKEIEIQQKGANRYMKQADSVKLSSDLKKKVREGTIDIKKYDENTQKLITSYKQWYEKSLACSDAVLTLKESLAELYKTRFSMVQKDYENRLSIIAHDAATLNNKIANIEEHGYLVDESHYEKLRTDAEKRLSLQKKERDELTKYLNEAVRSGYIKEGSEAWYELTNAINSASEAIQDSETEVVKYTNTIREVGWKHFDYILSQVTAITDEAGFMMELLEKSDSFVKEGAGAGQLTNTGKAILGLHGQTYNVYMTQADEYANEIKKINKEIAKDPNNTKLLDRREELLKKQRESILSAEGEKSAIRDMVEEGINYELDALKDLADKYTDALDNAKDLYDYQKKVKDQTSEIAKLEKQMLAYSNDSSEESKAVKQRLQVELAEARENLKDTQYEQSISEQKKLIDNLYNEYETVLNKRLDDVDALIAEEIAYANDNASAICQTIRAESESVGYIISQETAKIWSARSNPTLAVYDPSFSKAQTSTNQTINGVTNSLKKYARGGLVDYTGLAHVDGSPSNPEMVLSPSDTANFIALKDAMKKASDGDGLLAKLFGQSNTLAQLAKVGAIPDSSGTKIGNISYEINIPIERVLDYNDFVNQLVTDGKFESFLHAATTDRLVGGSKLAKNKYRW